MIYEKRALTLPNSRNGSYIKVGVSSWKYFKLEKNLLKNKDDIPIRIIDDYVSISTLQRKW